MSERIDEIIETLEELRMELAEANSLAGETQQFLWYATDYMVKQHRARAAETQYLQSFVQRERSVPRMPQVVDGKSVWERPEDLLDGEEALGLPIGSVVRWTRDRREGGERRRDPDGTWRPMLGGYADFYWVIKRG